MIAFVPPFTQKTEGLSQVKNWIFTVVRWGILLRHPRVAYWYWKLEGQHRLPNPANPQTANDKFFWRKVFDRNPVFTELSDKLQVRNWLARNGIEIDAARTLWAGEDPVDIPDAVLKGGVVAKANHGSRTNIVLNEPPPDREAFNRRMRRFKRKRQGRKRLEWGYFNIPRRLFVEEMLPNIEFEHKIYTYGDRIERIQIVYDHASDDGISADVWLPNGEGGWTRFEGSPLITRNANRPLPEINERALEIAREIGRHFDHIRVDLLSDGQNLWFGELTMYNVGGRIALVGTTPSAGVNTSWDLRKSWFMQNEQKGWRKYYADALRREIGARGY